MNTEKKEIIVPGQLTGPALLTGYLIKEVSVAPDRKRPAVIVCAGGGYWQRSDRESEPLALQFMAMDAMPLFSTTALPRTISQPL